MHAEINLTGPGRGSIKLDGHEISHSVRGFTLGGAHDSRPQLTLDLALRHPGNVTGEVDVAMSEATAQTLTTLGWTPPGDGAQHAAAVVDAAIVWRQEFLDPSCVNVEPSELSTEDHALIDAVDAMLAARRGRRELPTAAVPREMLDPTPVDPFGRMVADFYERLDPRARP